MKQYTGEPLDQPLSVFICPDANVSFRLYEDDGGSFNYRKGERMGVRLDWNDARRTLTLSLAPGSCLLPPLRRNLEVKLLDAEKHTMFDGGPIEVRFWSGARFGRQRERLTFVILASEEQLSFSDNIRTSVQALFPSLR